MLICATMAARPYEDVLAFEATLVVCFDSVLHVGDFGGWPDPKHIDKATNSHDGTEDFSIWLAKQQAVPRRTLFIKGNHTDFVWLDAQNNAEALPELFSTCPTAVQFAGANELLVRSMPGIFSGDGHRVLETLWFESESQRKS
jgi:hypothetical protein